MLRRFVTTASTSKPCRQNEVARRMPDGAVRSELAAVLDDWWHPRRLTARKETRNWQHLAAAAQATTTLLTGPYISRAARAVAAQGDGVFDFGICIIARPALNQEEPAMSHMHLSHQVASESGRLTARFPPTQARGTALPAPAG